MTDRKKTTGAADHRAMSAARDGMISAIRRADSLGVSSLVILGNGSYSWRNISANGLPAFIASIMEALDGNRALADIIIRSLHVLAEKDDRLASTIAYGLGDIVDDHRAMERETVKE